MVALLPVHVGRSRTERSRAVIPGELGQQQARPKAFSKNQGLLEKRQTDIGDGSEGKGDGWRREKKKKGRLNKRIGKTGVVCQQIDCS